MLSNREKNFKFHYRSQDVIGELKSPILLVHGEKDFKLPVDNSIRLLESALASGNYHLASSIPDGFASCNSKKIKQFQGIYFAFDFFFSILILLYFLESEKHNQCLKPSHPIEFIAIPDRSHSTSYKHPLWLDSIQKFVKEVESHQECCKHDY